MNQYKSFPRGDCIEPTDYRLIGNPIEFIAEDHLHVRAMCAELDRLATAKEINAEEAARIREFLTVEWPLLLADETEVLLPLLQDRAEEEDEIDRVWLRLQADRNRAATLLPDLVAMFSLPEEKRPALTADERDMLSQFTWHLRRQMILGNAVFIPLARHRLLDDDLDHLRFTMLERRGLDQLIQPQTAQEDASQ